MFHASYNLTDSLMFVHHFINAAKIFIRFSLHSSSSPGYHLILKERLRTMASNIGSNETVASTDYILWRNDTSLKRGPIRKK